MPKIFRDGKYEDVSMDHAVQWHIDTMNAMAPGIKIRAIDEAMCEITGVCLKDAKDLVDAIQRHAATPSLPLVTQDDLDSYVAACGDAAAAWKAEDALARRMSLARTHTEDTHNKRLRLAAFIINR